MITVPRIFRCMLLLLPLTASGCGPVFIAAVLGSGSSGGGGGPPAILTLSVDYDTDKADCILVTEGSPALALGVPPSPSPKILVIEAIASINSSPPPAPEIRRGRGVRQDTPERAPAKRSPLQPSNRTAGLTMLTTSSAARPT